MSDNDRWEAIRRECEPPHHPCEGEMGIKRHEMWEILERLKSLDALERKAEAYRLMFRLLCDDMTFVREPNQASPFLRPEKGDMDFAFACPEGTFDGEPIFSINVGDTFAYACADAEDIGLPDVFEVADLLIHHGWQGVVRWVQSRREQRGDGMCVPIPEVEASCLKMEDACAQRDAAAHAVGQAITLAQRKLDEILSTLDMTTWGEDELWQIQCHIDNLAEILTALGKPTERTLLMDWPERFMHGDESDRQEEEQR